MVAQQDPASKDSAGEAAREARDHPALDWSARAGMLAYGVVYLLVAWLAAQLALREPAGSASSEGALQELAQKPLGSVALWLAAAGLSALTVWEACQAVGGHRAEEGLRRWGARAASAGRGGVFAVLVVLAVRTAAGASSGGGEQTMTERVMSLPFGPALVIMVGIALAALGVFSIVRGLGDRWRKGLDVEGRIGNVGTVVEVLARLGYPSRGVAFLAIGGLFGWAGLTHDADKSGGLDQAIVRLRDEPFGPWILVVVAVGLACYGAFHVARAWYLRGA
ncbi:MULTISPECIES: DUF1206 domain-containing protein [Nocardioides]|uniref:DUF1206 domain-containing protein n=1 Tax=Nocardioides vastitatis TaxID=2568655 RepID=A0ABW0ZG03_9ACTN|nr:DUF1206 domain-containing protein [Nocardioides sp.]